MKVLDINDNVFIFNLIEYWVNIIEYFSIEMIVVYFCVMDLDVCNMLLKILLYYYVVLWKKIMYVGICVIVIWIWFEFLKLMYILIFLNLIFGVGEGGDVLF